MIERDIIAQKAKEHYIKKYVEEKLPRVGISSIRLKKIPLGEKIIIETSRPSLVVGSKGANIKDLTRTLKKEFHLENPQIEINEVKSIFLDANIVAERIAGSLERFGSQRFKGVGHKVMENVINSGALGVELVISGKIPGARAKSWRFYQGYLKKCGDVSIEGVRKAQTAALLKTGVIGIKVAIMPPDLELPDAIEILDEPLVIVEEVKEIKKKAKKRNTKKKTAKKSKSELGEEVQAAKEEIKEEVKEELIGAGEKKEVAQKIAEEVKEETSKVVEEIVKEAEVVEEKVKEVKEDVSEPAQESKSQEEPVEEKTEELKEEVVVKESTKSKSEESVEEKKEVSTSDNNTNTKENENN
jgi:small subunit ribosomal protein S3